MTERKICIKKLS